MNEEVRKTVKTSLKVASDLWRGVKICAAKKGLKLAQVVEAATRKGSHNICI